MIFSAAEDSILTNISYQQFLIRCLDAREMLILSDKLAGRTEATIAIKHECSRRYISKIVRGIRRKLLKFFSSQ